MLRKCMDLTHLSGELLAKLNDQAYKAINTSGLDKMLDKRALKNQE